MRLGDCFFELATEDLAVALELPEVALGAPLRREAEEDFVMVGDEKGRREKATEELALKGAWKYVVGGSWIVVKYLKFSRCWSLQRYPTMSGGFYDEKVMESKKCDATIGRDLITSLQPAVKGGDMSIKWDDAAIPWRNVDSTVEDICLAGDCQSCQPAEQELNRMNKIPDAEHSEADLNEVAESADHLTTSEQQKLLALLKKCEDLFDGTLGAFTGAPHETWSHSNRPTSGTSVLLFSDILVIYM
jgi:hypothetical protein